MRDDPAETSPDQARTVEEKIALLRTLFADAPEVGRTALENVLGRLASSRLGKVSELTIVQDKQSHRGQHPRRAVLQPIRTATR